MFDVVAAADGDRTISRVELMNTLVAQFLDEVKLEAALDELWARWDLDGSGVISKEEFLAPNVGLLHFVRSTLLRTGEGDSTRSRVASSDHAAVLDMLDEDWFVQYCHVPPALMQRVGGFAAVRITRTDLYRGLHKTLNELRRIQPRGGLPAPQPRRAPRTQRGAAADRPRGGFPMSFDAFKAEVVVAEGDLLGALFLKLLGTPGQPAFVHPADGRGRRLAGDSGGRRRVPSRGGGRPPPGRQRRFVECLSGDAVGRG